MNEINFSFGNRIKNIVTIALPLIIEGVVFQLQSLTDKAFLGNLDTRFVSAIGSAQMPFNAIGDSLIAIVIGLTIIVSRLFGSKEFNKICTFVKSSLVFHSLIGITVFVMWQLFAKNIFLFFEVSPQVIDFSIEYIKICAVYMIFLGIDAVLQGFLHGIGNTKPIMITGIIKVVLNIAISYVLIFGKLGFPALFVKGAAYGTLAANIISCFYLSFYCFVYKQKEYNLMGKNSFKNLSIKPYINVLKLGIPSGIEYLLWNFSNLILIRFINGFSYQSMAIYSLTYGCQCLIYVVFNSTSRATLTLMGQFIGSKNYKASEKHFNSCILLNFAIVIVAAAIFALIPQKILSIFSKDLELIKNGVPYLIFMGIIMIPQSLNVICGNGIKAKCDTKWMLISQIIGSSIVISFSFFLISVCKMNMMAIYITLFFDETIRSILNYTHCKRKAY